MSGAITFKQIDPAPLRVDKMRLALLSQLHVALRGMVKDFEATVATWDKKPEFERSQSLALGGASISVITNDEIYRYVNDGTPPHDIPIWRPGPLVFIWGGKGSYKPKTKAKTIVSTPGGPTGIKTVRRHVHHPGIVEPRKFDVTIQEKWEPEFERLMEKGMAKAREESGHTI